MTPSSIMLSTKQIVKFFHLWYGAARNILPQSHRGSFNISKIQLLFLEGLSTIIKTMLMSMTLDYARANPYPKVCLRAEAFLVHTSFFASIRVLL